ncbi:MAG TPA: hypothetical protein VFQ89_12885, partial [Candidatus Binatia bacterium]|nr:hypothetical protein [Candidatus Binatia bacterium]
DGPFERVEGEASRSFPVTEPDQEHSEDQIDELLRQDGLAPVPRGDAPVDVVGDREVSPLARMAAVGWNEFLAVQQWTSPDTSRYEKLGRYAEADFGGVYIDAAGRWVPIDLRRHAVLIDPNRGEIWVYRRSPETEEGRLLSFARLFGMGLGGESSVTSAKAALRARQLAQEGAGDAARTFGVGIGPTGRGAAETISGAAKGEAWVVEKAVPGIGKDAGLVHKVTKPGKASFASEETTLFMVPREPLAADVLKIGRPLGLMDDATFTEFKNILREEKAKLPPDTSFAMRGSAVTGNGFKDTAHGYTKDFFDVGRTSDHDIAIISRTLFEKARESGATLRQGGIRTDVLRVWQVEILELESFLARIHELTDRTKTRLMIYKSVDALNKRGANIQFDLR